MSNKDPSKLSYKQRLFLEIYLETYNATRAAREAGYAHPDVQGPRMLDNVGIRAAIEAALAKRAMQADEVLDRLTTQARLNAAQFFVFEDECVKGDDEEPVIGPDGKQVQRPVMKGIDWAFFQDHGHLVKKLGYTRDGRPVIEFHDPQKALEMLARRHGLLVDKHEHSGPGGGPIPVIGIEVVKPMDADSADDPGGDEEPDADSENN